MEKPSLLIFDVNETLLNLQPMEVAINEYFDSSLAFTIWFDAMLQYSMVETLTGGYSDFGEIGRASLLLISKKFKKDMPDKRIKDILDKISSLSPHTEVPTALDRLKRSGYKIVALTNGGKETVDDQLANAGIQDYFDAVYSVETVKKFKPHPDPYGYVIKKEGVSESSAMLIAAHGWDIVGAQRAGLLSAFIQRPGKFQYALGKEADLTADSLRGIADQLL